MGTERKKYAGGCACGEIRFGFYEPVLSMNACHCRACQYASGGGPAYYVDVQGDQFRVTRGHPREYMTLSESGHAVTRLFCATCGTHVYSWTEGDPDTRSVRVGCLDGPFRFKPRRHIWTSDAPSWHAMRRLARRFRRNPRGAGSSESG